MSNSEHASTHEKSRGGYQLNTQVVLNLLFTVALPVVLIIWLVSYVTTDHRPALDPVSEQLAIASRIQKVGTVEVGAAVREIKNGEQVFQARCAACHNAGVAGAPKFGDAAAWSARIGSGYDALLNSVLKGKNGMGAQSGGDLSDYELARGMVYMVNAGGGKFAEPKAPETAEAKP